MSNKHNHPPMVKSLLAAMLLVLSYSLPAQLSERQHRRLDSLHAKFQADSAHIYRFQKVRPYLAIDQRNSWIKNVKGDKNVPVNVNGFQLGVILHEKHTVGLGLYGMSKSSMAPKKLTDRDQHVTYQNLSFGYATIFYQYTIIDRRYFELDVPMEIGIGSYNYFLQDSAKNILPKSQETGPMRLTGGGVNIVLKPFRWIGISGMAGYRICAFNKHTDLNLNGFYYSYGVWVDVRQIIRDTKYYAIKKRRYKKEVRRIITGI